MLKTVRDACKPHQMAIDSALADQIEDLGELLDRAADGADFYAKNHMTAGMRQLFELGLRRLAGKSDQAVFELTQAMGGGKTHTMIAFGLLARDETLRAKIVPDLARVAPFSKAQLVAVTGRRYPDHFLWGEIAAQLGRADQFQRYWQNGPVAPDEPAWVKLIGDEPTLILLDELPPYFDNAITRPVGGGTLAQVATAALSNLLSAALKLPRLCIVVSNLSGTYEGASKDLRKAIRNVEQEARRQAKPITPVELGGDEIYQILKKRLFEKLPSDENLEQVAQAYAQALKEAEKSKSIAKSTEQIVDEIRGSYPFHPAIKDIIALFRNNESYRQTRGLMQFVAKAIRSVWNRADNDVYLIGLQHLDLNDTEVREEVSRISDLRGAISHDIAASGAALAETIDANLRNDAASQVARIILAASLSTSVDAVKGLTKQRLLEYLIAPMRTAHEFADAFEHLKREAWYLHRDASEAYYFSNIENLTKRLSTEADRAPAPKIELEMRRRLEAIFKPTRRAAYQEVRALPNIDEINLGGPRLLLILSPDTRNPPEQAAKFYEHVVEKNNFCVLTGDGSDIANLDQCTRMLYAVHKVREQQGEASPLRGELEEKREQAEQDFNSTVISTFNRVYYPMKTGLTAAKLAMVFNANHFDGEEQIEKALAGPGASKLILDVEAESAALIKRAEERLWPQNQKRVPWRDIKARALATTGWSWLPHNGLDHLRRIAEQQGAWRSADGSYIEKGPFEKPKTQVSVVPREYDDATGRATLDVKALHAGPNAQVHYDTKAEVSTKSPRATNATLETDATKLWFIAVDPTGGHETGPATIWDNQLTITHQPREGVGKRSVELRVVPRGRIRYTLNGSNPAEGTDYNGPFEIGQGEVSIYCYAEDQRITTRRTFTIAPAGNAGVRLDATRPARLRKKIEAQDTADSFKLIARAREAKLRLGSARVQVGDGDKNATVRFGSSIALTSEVLKTVIDSLRSALGNETAEVRLAVGTVEFQSGHDLDEFVKERGLQLTPNEVEQQ
jgi:hypothetical protein